MSQRRRLVEFGVCIGMFAAQGVLIGIASQSKDLLIARDLLAVVFAIGACEWGLGPFFFARWSRSRRRQQPASRLARAERIARIMGAETLALLHALVALLSALGVYFSAWLSDSWQEVLTGLALIAGTGALCFLTAGALMAVRAVTENPPGQRMNTTMS